MYCRHLHVRGLQELALSAQHEGAVCQADKTLIY